MHSLSRTRALSLAALALSLAGCTAVMPTALSSAEPAAGKSVLAVAWMSPDFSQEITTAVTCQDIGILVTTQGYAPGDPVTVTVSSTDDGEKVRDVALHGTVDAHGMARVSWPAMGCLDQVAEPDPPSQAAALR